MKKRYVIEELCCANCAAKMEDGIRKIDGVNSVTINFLTQKLTLDAADDRFDSILNEAERIIKKIEPDCVLIR